LTPYLLVGLAAAVVAYIATPVAGLIATRIGAIDHPNDRKVHAKPTPTLGGMAIFFGLAAAGVAAVSLPELKQVITQSSAPLGIVAAGVVIFALGAVDDLRDLPAPVKLAGQVFAAGILFLSGVRMQFLPLPNGDVFSLGQDVSVLVTVAWLVLMINAVNLTDGLDGLAAGVVAIAASSFFVYSYELSQVDIANPTAAPLIAIATVGACLGFLRFNFHPARIFMGDSGSMLLGLVLGAATVIGIAGAPTAVNETSVFLAYAPLLIPLSVVALPIADALLAIVRRARRRRSVFHADKEHLHHRLMDLGHGHRQAVIVMYIWSALAAGTALGFTFLEGDDLVYVLPIAVGALVLYTLFPVLTRAIQNRMN
jgi:UDP-GlcNAc:undecaprenyl-phosphate GlcNAc-1-phosphate transferase